MTHKKIREVLQAHLIDLNGMPLNKALFQTQRKSRFTANTLGMIIFRLNLPLTSL